MPIFYRGTVALQGRRWSDGGVSDALPVREAVLTPAEAREVVGKLLHNVYRSFDFRQEGAVYDMLAGSVDGPLLESTYLETRKSLVLENQGGARARVNEVEVDELQPRPRQQGFAEEPPAADGPSPLENLQEDDLAQETTPADPFEYLQSFREWLRRPPASPSRAPVWNTCRSSRRVDATA